MVAARWPDDIRSNKEYTHPTWHYVDFGIVFPSDHGKVTAEAPPEPNALTALDEQTKVLAGNGSPADKAIALCWVNHLVGDIHQPLHACSLYTASLPKGDKGGNSDIVRVDSGRGSINLHTLWDGLMTSDESYNTTAKIAKTLEMNPDYAKNKLPGESDAKPYDWAWESYNAAVHTAYLDGALK